MSLRVDRRLVSWFSWVRLTLLVGAILTVVWTRWAATGIDARVVSDTLLFAVVPWSLAVLYGRDLGFRVDRRAVRHTLALAAVVLPFYLVGSSLPSIRAYYPMWGLHSVAPAKFIPHTAKLLLIVLAAETYYRGFLCVGVRELGPVSIFISPVIYALAHVAKPPIELLLSGPTDVLFGAVDYRSTSLLPSFVAHGCGLVLLDWLVLHPPLFAPDRVVSYLTWLPVRL